MSVDVRSCVEEMYQALHYHVKVHQHGQWAVANVTNTELTQVTVCLPVVFFFIQRPLTVSFTPLLVQAAASQLPYCPLYPNMEVSLSTLQTICVHTDYT